MTRGTLVGVALAFAGFAWAPSQQTVRAASADEAFMSKAAQVGISEVSLGMLAVDKGFTPDVKRFAQRMKDDHGRAGEELQALALRKSVTLATGVDGEAKAMRERLSSLNGEAFDRAYIEAMIDGHQRVIDEFRAEVQQGQDPDVKAWASKTLSTIESHLQHAKAAERAIGHNPIHH